MKTKYEHCPLCDSIEFTNHLTTSCSWHKLWKPGLPEELVWMKCNQCDHVFTDGIFTTEALALLFSETNPNQIPGQNTEHNRGIWAPTVKKVASHTFPGNWLDIGFGNGALLEVAQEFGYTCLGIDSRPQSVELLNQRGIEAKCIDFLDFSTETEFEIISLFDCLEHTPYPKKILEHAFKSQPKGGLIIISLPNMDTAIWRDLDRNNSNPYWGEIEHYHNFTRQRLISLLEETGYQFCCYDIPLRWRIGMEIIARKVMPD